MLFLSDFRAFAVTEADDPVDADSGLAEWRLRQQYQTKLHIDGMVYLDPYTFYKSWTEQSVHFLDNFL